MAQYIDKAAVVAEIESYKDDFCDRNGNLEDCETNGLAYDTLCKLEYSINTLEVKDVDLNATDKQKQQWVEKACDVYCKDCEYIGCDKFECLALEKFRKAMEE